MTPYFIGEEALAVLEYILGQCRREDAVLCDGGAAVCYPPYAPPEQNTAPGETIVITGDLKIMLPDRDNLEIRLRPLPKMLFLLFLKHPEGINFKDLSLYEDEMMSIYARLSHRLDNDGMKRTIAHIVNMTDSNSINTQRNNVRKMLSRYFTGPALDSYTICGSRRQDKFIPLDRTLVRWEQ